MGVKIHIGMDDAEMAAVMAKQRASWDDNEKAAAKYEGTAGRANQKIIGYGKSIVKQNRSVEQVLKDRVTAIEKAAEAEEISKQQAVETIAKLKDSYRKQGKAAEDAALRGSAAYKENTKRVAEGKAKVDQLKKSNQTLEDQYRDLRTRIHDAWEAGKLSLNEYKTSLKQLKAEHRNLQANQDKSFGAKAIGQVGKYAASFMTVAAAVTVVRDALKFMNEEKEKALGSSESLVEVRRSLRQISKGDFDQLESKADKLTGFGIDRVKSRQLVFDARSSGFEGQEATVALANPVIEVSDGAAFAGAFRKFFSDDKLTVEQAFNTGLAGAAESQFNISQLLPVIRVAAQGALEGGESSDVVAAASVLVDNFGVSTGDRLRALGTKIATDSGTKGMSLIPAVEKMIANPKLADEIIKDSSELKAVFAKFSQRLGDIKAADSRIEVEQGKSGAGGLLRKAVAEAYDPSTNAGRRELARLDALRSATQREIGQEGELSEVAFSNKAFKDRTIAADPTMIGRFGTSVTLGAMDMMGFDLQEFQAKTDRADNLLGGTKDPESREQRNRIITELMGLNDTAKKAAPEIKINVVQ